MAGQEYFGCADLLLVQIRDSSSTRDRLEIADTSRGVLESASRGFQFFTSPIDAAFEARYTTASFRNDANVNSLDSYEWDFGQDKEGKPDKPKDPATFFTTVVFENSAEVSLDPGDFWDKLTNLDLGKPTKRDFREASMSWLEEW